MYWLSLCHGWAKCNAVSCIDDQWLNHLTQGRVSESAFEKVSISQDRCHLLVVAAGNHQGVRSLMIIVLN